MLLVDRYLYWLIRHHKLIKGFTLYKGFKFFSLAPVIVSIPVSIKCIFQFSNFWSSVYWLVLKFKLKSFSFQLKSIKYSLIFSPLYPKGKWNQNVHIFYTNSLYARGEAFLELELMVWECPLKFLASEALFRHTKLWLS